MFKYTAGQKIRVFAFDRATAAPVTGDAANITCKVSINNGTAVALADTNPTETEDGYYLFDLAITETNGDTLDFYPESSTSGVQVITVGHDRQTVAAPNTTTPIEDISGLQELMEAIGPKSVKTKEVEIESHSPMVMQRLLERQKTKPVTLSQFPKTMVSPKDASYPCCKE